MSHSHNPGIPLDLGWIDSVRVNLSLVNRRAKVLPTSRIINGKDKIPWLVRAINCIDLTTLAGDDTPSNVHRLVHKALRPLHQDILDELDVDVITVAAVCVYPARVEDAAKSFTKFKRQIPIAAVATGFPSGQYSLKSRIDEIKYAIASGATEIDIVINRTLALKNDWDELYKEVKSMKEACGPKIHMKSILAVGELGTLSNVYKCSLICMMAGSDFIKTSTGKEGVNAILPVGIVMTRAIRDYHERTGFIVGFKPAGGIRTSEDAINWLILMKEELGDMWLCNNLFRIGASGLLTDIETNLYKLVKGCHPNPKELCF
ncbi:deoxyribose-phosphate aldolase [Lepeophtheirus salmonis]|uniref:deoxyribose-phosphate aldolase n=1 Tax=Lepeophtheirus salmonis TaxID=72036 RepID=UPI001AE1BFE6|nr:deoxyribose-phosphate aldolase-like [Lepeophtheirus salmonis]